MPKNKPKLKHSLTGNSNKFQIKKMEKIFNFFRFTNQSVFGTARKKLLLIIINDDGRIIQLEAFADTTVAEVISNSLVELEITEPDYRSHQMILVRNGNVINYNTSMDAASVLDNGIIVHTLI